MQVNILYFASVREQLDCSKEALEVSEPMSLQELKSQLALRGGVWKLFSNQAASILSAVNQRMESDEFKIKAGDEIAFFPPVTGG